MCRCCLNSTWHLVRNAVASPGQFVEDVQRLEFLCIYSWYRKKHLVCEIVLCNMTSQHHGFLNLYFENVDELRCRINPVTTFDTAIDCSNLFWDSEMCMRGPAITSWEVNTLLITALWVNLMANIILDDEKNTRGLISLQITGQWCRGWIMKSSEYPSTESDAGLEEVSLSGNSQETAWPGSVWNGS